MKVYNYYDLSNRDYRLTDLVQLKKGNSKFHVVLSDFLADYGVHLQHSISVMDLSGNKHTQVYGCFIHKDIPIENIEIIDQMYGYTNSKIHIGVDRNENRWIDFEYNTESKECRLFRIVYGNESGSIMYDNFEKMMKDIRSKESIDELFEKP